MSIRFIEIDYTRWQKMKLAITCSWKWLNNNAGATALILSIIGIIVAIAK